MWTIQWRGGVGNKQICIYSKELHYSKNYVVCILLVHTYKSFVSDIILRCVIPN